MKKIRYIFVLTALILSSCIHDNTDGPLRPTTTGDNSINLLCSLTDNSDSDSSKTKNGGYGTRSLINQLSVQSLQTNFLRLDENIDSNNNGTYTYGSWANANVIQGQIAASPDNTLFHYRSISLDPLQTYKTYSTGSKDNNNLVTTYYNTRMIGWYPQSCNLAVVDGEKVSAPFSSFTSVMSSDVVDGKTVTGITFTGLDGTKDIMVSNMKEGQRKHNPDDTNSLSSHDNNPFGRYGTGSAEHNHFEFKHYLSAIRVYAFAEQSQTSLATWGTINGVSIADQPTECKISIPDAVDTFGGAYYWAKPKTLPIQTDPMFDDMLNYENLNESVTFPVSMESKSSIDDPVYLGYSLIRPNHEVVIEIETAAGIMSVSVPPIYKTATGDVDILKEGYIYNIKLNLTTSGAIEIFLTNDDNETFENLSSWDKTYSRYKNANCFIVNPENPNNVDGYIFDGTIVGNGDEGIIANASFDRSVSDINPVAAKLIWESSYGLINGVELVEQYVRFRTPTTNEGNAVIGVYADHECTDLLWSWHIWITDTPQDVIYRNVPVNLTTQDIVILDRNLGATLAPSSAESWNAEKRLETYGLYYQWGRKDPSPGPFSYDYSSKDMTTASYYDYSATKQTTVPLSLLSEPTINNGIKTPLAFILPNSLSETYYFNWLNSMIDELWGYNPTTESMMTKTIYDPCPYGYRVAGDELYYLLKESSRSTSNNGGSGVWVSYASAQSYFPWAGYKGVDRNFSDATGAWKYVGQKGDYQDARTTNDVTNTVNGQTVRYYKHRGRQYLSSSTNWTELQGDFTYSGNLTQDYTNRRTGASVRCVRESASDVSSLEIALNITPNANSILPNTTINIVASATERNTSDANRKLDNITLYYSINGNSFAILKKEDLSSTTTFNGTLTYSFRPTEYGDYRIKAVVTNNSGTSSYAINEFKVEDFVPEISITVLPTTSTNNAVGHTVAVSLNTNVSDVAVSKNQSWATLNSTTDPTQLTINDYFSGALLTGTITGTGTTANSLSGTWNSSINENRSVTLTAASASYPAATATATYTQRFSYSAASMSVSYRFSGTNSSCYYWSNSTTRYITVNVPAGLKTGDTITINGGAYKGNTNTNYDVSWWLADSSGSKTVESSTVTTNTKRAVTTGTFTITVPSSMNGDTSFRLYPDSEFIYSAYPAIRNFTITR